MISRNRVLLLDVTSAAGAAAQLIPYAEAWRWQRALLSARVNARDNASRASLPDVIFTLEHAPVYTLGRAAQSGDLRFGQSGVAGAEMACGSASLPSLPGFDVVAVDRGGKITYHGPGQLVVYPLLDLKRHREDLHWFVRSIEEVIITSLRAVAGLAAFRRAGSPGVWVGQPGAERKIAAVGMNASKWATQHGFAVNVDAGSVAAFDRIVPCGIADRGVTSIAHEVGAWGSEGMAEFKLHTLSAFSSVFDVDIDASVGKQPLSAAAARARATELSREWEAKAAASEAQQLTEARGSRG